MEPVVAVALITSLSTLSGVIVTLVGTRKREFDNWLRSEKAEAYVEVQRFLSHTDWEGEGEVIYLNYARGLIKASARSELVAPTAITEAINSLISNAHYTYKNPDNWSDRERLHALTADIEIKLETVVPAMKKDLSRPRGLPRRDARKLLRDNPPSSD